MSVWAKVRHDTMYGPPEIGVYQCEVHFVDEENKRVLVYHNYTLQWVEIKDINNI